MAKYEFVKLHVVVRRGNVKKEGGGVDLFDVGFYQHEEMAHKFIEAMPTEQQGPYIIQEREVLKIGKEHFLLERSNSLHIADGEEFQKLQAKKKIALAKLTKADKHVLGLVG